MSKDDIRERQIQIYSEIFAAAHEASMIRHIESMVTKNRDMTMADIGEILNRLLTRIESAKRLIVGD